MAISNYLENKILEHTLKGVLYEAPTVVYLALYLDNPTDDNLGTEINGNGYARKPITFGVPNQGIISNDMPISMPISTGEWGEITHIGILDNITGGNLLYYGALSVPQIVQANNQLYIDTNQLKITLD